MIKEQKLDQITMALISNINFEPYFRLFINHAFASDGINVNIVSINYIELSSDTSMRQIENSEIVVIVPNFEDFYRNIGSKSILDSDELQNIINREKFNFEQICSIIHLKSNTSSIIWLGYEDYYINYYNAIGNVSFLGGLIDKLNIQLFSQKEKNVVFIDLKRLIALVGIENAYNHTNKYRWNAPYSKKMVECICKEIYKQYCIMKGITKKCIILDCDNVLWGGILSEDYIGGIRLAESGLGRSFQDFQRYLLFLYNHGVILTICSKNDEDDIMRVFREHSGMILKEEHIACFQVNWDNKFENIKKISEILNIGLDSIVFVDDSEFEIQTVRSFLPEVTAIQYTRDGIYKQLSCFNLNRDVEFKNIQKRNNTYKTIRLREQLKTKCQSFDDYLKMLEVSVDKHKALPSELARISELTQRTNKCTNGKRYTVRQLISQVQKENYILYSVSVSDKFSDLGIVGAIGIFNHTLDLFSLSCRALGRNVEEDMFCLLRREKVENFDFYWTGKNDELNIALKSFLKICNKK